MVLSEGYFGRCDSLGGCDVRVNWWYSVGVLSSASVDLIHELWNLSFDDWVQGSIFWDELVLGLSNGW